MKVRLDELATVLRSKNADPFITTCDVIVKDDRSYVALKASNVLSRERVAGLYGIPIEAVVGVFWVDRIRAVKISFFKMSLGKYIASGDLEDLDVLGAQQHVPLRHVVVELP